MTEAEKIARKMKKAAYKRFTKDMEEYKKAKAIAGKKRITKREVVLIADAIKKGMSIKVLRDLEELKRLKVPLAKRS